MKLERIIKNQSFRNRSYLGGDSTCNVHRSVITGAYTQGAKNTSSYVNIVQHRNVILSRAFSTRNRNYSTDITPALISCVEDSSSTIKILRLSELANAYRTLGHCIATIDPLNLPKRFPFHKNVAENLPSLLTPEAFGLTAEDLSSKLPKLDVLGHLGHGGTVYDCIEGFKKSYCGDISFEFAHISNKDVHKFFIKRVEDPNFLHSSKEQHLKYFERIYNGVRLEQVCAKTFPTVKRFGLDGLESTLLILYEIEKAATNSGVDTLMMAMSHRGRLNVLANVLDKPLELIFAEFRGKNWFISAAHKSGDVKYHFGYDTNKNGLKIKLLNNPSHLQFVHPVLAGKTKAYQKELNDDTGDKVIPLIMHGDAALSGEGIAYETIQLSKVPGYSLGGTIHIVVNNQIGFTTYPGEGSSSRYPSDIGKIVEAPTIHVNSRNIEAVAFAGRMAFEYRQRFHNDVFINIVGFRKFGHNELDMPKFTNALMYKQVANTPDVLAHYRSYLLDRGLVAEEELKVVEERLESRFKNAIDASVKIDKIDPPALSEGWNLKKSCLKTGVSKDELIKIGELTSTIPEDITPHPAIKRIFDARLRALKSTEKEIDYGFAEILAYASLASQGFNIRITGQDTKRGTFSHRHSAVQCQKTFEDFEVFSKFHYSDKINIYNSILSEVGVLGFEYGYSIHNPNTLCIWEAQFGDFSNVAQPIFDEFVCSGETKWNQPSGLVMFLPHGYDGQGPDHSSARVERYLQLSNEREDLSDAWLMTSEEHARACNISVVNCSVASNLFHLLRRHMLRDFRKPIVAITGKKMLKLRHCFCSLDDLGLDKGFLKYIPEAEHRDAETLVLCSGQVYYDLYERRADINARVAIARIEELTPFPAHEILEDLKNLPNLKTIKWCQEEPMNAGPWSFISPRINSVLKKLNHEIKEIIYTGRVPCAAPSSGDMKLHKLELEQFLNEVF